MKCVIMKIIIMKIWNNNENDNEMIMILINE